MIRKPYQPSKAKLGWEALARKKAAELDVALRWRDQLLNAGGQRAVLDALDRHILTLTEKLRRYDGEAGTAHDLAQVLRALPGHPC